MSNDGKNITGRRASFAVITLISAITRAAPSQNGSLCSRYSAILLKKNAFTNNSGSGRDDANQAIDDEAIKDIKNIQSEYNGAAPGVRGKLVEDSESDTPW